MALEGQLSDFNLAEILQLLSSQQKSGFLNLETTRNMVFIFDKGVLADGEGRVVDFKNTVIIMTSNLATDLVTQLGAGDPPPASEDLVNTIRPVLSHHFKPALLARML